MSVKWEVPILNILVPRNYLSGNMENGIPDTETTIDRLDYTSSGIEALSSPKPLCSALAGFAMVKCLIGYVPVNLCRRGFLNCRTVRTSEQEYSPIYQIPTN